MDRFWSGKIGTSFERAEKTAASWGAAGAHSAHKAWAGPLAPPMLWFCGSFGPAKRRRPPRGPIAPHRPFASPPPPALRRLPGAHRKAPAFRRGRRRLAAGGGPQGRPRPAKQKERGRGQRPRAPLFQGASRPAAAPPAAPALPTAPTPATLPPALRRLPRAPRKAPAAISPGLRHSLPSACADPLPPRTKNPPPKDTASIPGPLPPKSGPRLHS